MKDFKIACNRLKGAKVIDYKILYEDLAHRPCNELDKEAELVFKLCEWKTNDNG